MKVPKNNLFRNIFICAILSVLQVLLIFISPSLYIQLLTFTLSAILYGILSPQKGWVLAIVQTIIITGGYFLFQNFGFVAYKSQEATYSALIAIFPNFIVSYISSRLFVNSK